MIAQKTEAQEEAEQRPQVFAGLLARGQAIDVTRSARPRLADGAVLAVHVDAYDRFVLWNSRAMRKLLICLCERDRLEKLIAAACLCSHTLDSMFVCRAVDAKGDTPAERRFVFGLHNYGTPAQPLWLVR